MTRRILPCLGFILILCFPVQVLALASHQVAGNTTNDLRYPSLVRQLQQQPTRQSYNGQIIPVRDKWLWHTSNQALNLAGQEILFLTELMTFIGSDAHAKYLWERLQLLKYSSSGKQAVEKRERYLSDAVLLFAELYIPVGQYADKSQAFESWFSRLDVATRTSEKLEVIDELHPTHSIYRTLRPWFDTYRQLAKTTSWPTISLPSDIEIGEQHEHVELLRQRLTLLGDIGDIDSLVRQETAEVTTSPSINPRGVTRHSVPNVYDDSLHLAVKRFQQRHGLEVDGVIGKATRHALNTSPQKRQQQIAANMGRWLSNPYPTDDQYVLVNVPDYRLHYVYNGEKQLDMEVVVGKPEHETPIFTADISQIVLNPTWTPTHNIIVNELIPQFRRDPKAFSRNDFRVYSSWKRGSAQIPERHINWHAVPRNPFPYKLVQQAGPKNPLGKFKFNLPNRHQVYLHDTSAPYLFERTRRAFSHGCIRVAKPRELAAAILSSQHHLNENQASQLLEGVHSPKTSYLNLRKRVPVHVVYWTAWVDEMGQIQFRDDLYKRDTVHSE